MPRNIKRKSQESKRSIRVIPTGGVTLSEERLQLLAPQWEKFASSLRRMDGLSLGETEPATLFVWRPEKP